MFATGLALHLGWITLPPAFESLHVLADPVVLFVSGALYVVEFIADKVPFVEHAWDAVHTFIRPLGAAWLAWTAVSGTSLSPSVQIATVLLVGSVATSAHLGKAGTRVVATASGGHFFGLNTLLSLGEDIVSLVVAPLAIAHPVAALLIAGTVLAALLLVVAAGYRYIRGTLTPRRT